MTDQNRQERNMAGGFLNELYEASVGVRALERAGANPQLKGHVHEFLFCDKFNFDPRHFLRGEHACLTKSPTATMKDVIIKNWEGKIIGHAQLKDTVSSSGVTKTVQQILDGHYNKTAIYGTKETAKLVNEALAKMGKTAQQVYSSGISSTTTQRIADKVLGRMPASASAFGAAASSGGTAGAVLGAGVEAVSSLYDLFDGQKTSTEAMCDIAYAGAKGGITGAASGVAGSAAAGAAGTLISAATATSVGGALAATAGGALAVTAAPILLGLGAAFSVGSFVSGLFDD